MPGLRLGRTARRRLARLTHACAVALERFAVRVEPGRARPPAVPTEQPPQHWLDDIQRGGKLDWIRFSARERGRPRQAADLRSISAPPARLATRQLVANRADTADLIETAPTRPRLAIRPQPAGTPPRARPTTPDVAEPRLTLRYAPRLARPEQMAAQRRSAPSGQERADDLDRDRPAAAAIGEQSVTGVQTYVPPPFELDARTPEDLFPEWPAAIESEHSPVRQRTGPDDALTRPAADTSATPTPWEPLTRPTPGMQRSRRISDTDVTRRTAVSVEQPWPALPDSAPEYDLSDRAAWAWARGRRDERHLRRLDHEQRGEPWSEWRS